MDFQLTDEQQLISETAREFADHEIAPRVRDNDRAARFDRELASKLGEVGYLGAPGRRGVRRPRPRLHRLRADRRAGRPRRLLGPHRRLGADLAGRRLDRALGHRGAEAEVAAAALLGRGARLLRPDRARHRLRRRQPAHPRDQDRLRLVDQRPEDVDLARQLLRGGADLRPDRPGARSTAASPASSSRPTARASPRRRSTASSACAPPTPRELSLDEVEVGEDAMLGEIGDGFKVAMSALDNGRYSVAAGCVGICDGCVDASVAYAKERKQFGVPLARFQLVQEMIADMILKRDASADAGLPRRRAQGRRQAEHDGDLGGEALRDRVGGRVRQPGDPGPRRLRLRRRLPGRALPARRPRDDALRGHLADPEADHRPRRDRDQRDDADGEAE